MSFVISESVQCEGTPSYIVFVKDKSVAIFENENLTQIDTAKDGSRQCLFPFSTQTLHIQFNGHPVLIGTLLEKSICLYSVNDESIFAGLQVEWYSLRDVFLLVNAQQFQIASRALQLHEWLQDHKYCGHCATPTKLAADDRAVVCPECERRFYPRFSPCVIGAIVDGKRLLLAKAINRSDEMYSVIAGFIEVGENVEEAFHREVMEEVGLQVKNVRYICSQNWPFPSQLMLGFIADYDAGDINIDPKEIADAQWFDIDNLPQTPPEHTISGRLIRCAMKQISGENECI